MIKAYRKEWKDKKLWVSVVQLPNFEIDNEPGNKSWYRMREALRRCSADLEYSESVVSFDLGEDNDLHPQNKKELGRRLALVAAKECLNMDVQALGPVISNVFVTYENDECAINLEMDEVGEGLQVLPANGKGEKDGRVLDFIIRDEDANDYECDVKIFSDKIILRCSGLKRDAAEIRYCYANTNKGPLVYNSNGLPLSPGIYTVI